jgi:hypothetical protein
MLEFTLYNEDDHGDTRRVLIDPADVASVEESERRPAYGASRPVAVVTMANGYSFVVEDDARRAAALIREAKAASRPEGE